MEALTSELVLVDPELAARARAALPDPPDCLSRSYVGEQRRSSPAPEIARDTPRRDLGRRRIIQRAPVVASWAAFAAFVGTSLLAFIPPGESARPVLLDAPRAPSALPGGPGGSTPLLRWAAAPMADAYNVILVTDAGRHDTWVRGTSVRLRVKRSDRGSTSRWYVYPVRTEAGTYRYGEIAARGSIDSGDVSFFAPRRGGVSARP